MNNDLKYKIVAIDVDGTLVDSNGKFPKENIQALRNAHDKGVIIALCTGRPIQGAKPIIEAIGLDIPFICYNGSMVILGESKHVLFQKTLLPRDTIKIFKLGVKYGSTVMVWSCNRLYVSRFDKRSEEYSKLARTEPEAIVDIEQIARDGANKVLWFDEVDRINELSASLETEVDNSITYHTSKPFFLEFVDKEVSKGLALKMLGEYYGISREEIIAIGDAYNDVSMIEYAGLGVAMKNAPNDIKAKADYITLSNDENGVAHVVNKFILE